MPFLPPINSVKALKGLMHKNQEKIGVGSSNSVAGLDTPYMRLFKVKGQGHKVT